MAIFINQPSAQTGQATAFVCSRSSSYSHTPIKVTAENGALKAVTPYDPRFVDRLKTEIPRNARSWDKDTKAWLVSPRHADKLKQIIDETYGANVVMPTVIAGDVQIFEITIKADYVANCRDGFSNVHANGDWNAKIPEKVLRKWFNQDAADDQSGTSPASGQKPSAAQTYYAMLGVSKDASAADIKKAYKRAARQWHPDVCREPDAREMFEKVKAAYDVLGDVIQRARYNAGLAFQALASAGNSAAGRRSRYVPASSSFIPILRCGMITLRAKKELGNIVAEEILAWDDIRNDAGAIMVSFWEGDNFAVAWV